MCQYSRIDDPQRYTKEELTSKETEHRVCNIIKIVRDEELGLTFPMFENGNYPEVRDPSFCHHYVFL
jgi:hypothetical protein